MIRIIKYLDHLQPTISWPAKSLRVSSSNGTGQGDSFPADIDLVRLGFQVHHHVSPADFADRQVVIRAKPFEVAHVVIAEERAVHGLPFEIS